MIYDENCFMNDCDVPYPDECCEHHGNHDCCECCGPRGPRGFRGPTGPTGATAPFIYAKSWETQCL